MGRQGQAFGGALRGRPRVKLACPRNLRAAIILEGEKTVRVGVFTALLSQLPLEDVLKKLKSLDIHTAELGTGNYPGDPHCKLSMLKSKMELNEFKKKLDDHGVSISALSCHGNALHPDRARAKHDAEVSRQTVLLGEEV